VVVDGVNIGVNICLPWAQRKVLELQRQAPKKLKSEAGANLIASGKFTEEDNPIPELKNPAINLNILIEEAKKQYADGVLIAIDDLDKQDPKRVRDLMHNAQGMLKGSAYITHEVLEAGLREAYSNFREQAALKMQTQRVLGLLGRKGGLSDESITLEELHSIGFSSFNEIVPFLERLQDADLAYRRDLEDATEYEAILPPGSVEAIAELPPNADSID
jgi:hypothetical protein